MTPKGTSTYSIRGRDKPFSGNQAGVFYSLERTSGKVVWQVSLDAPIEVSPVFAEGRFYVRTTDGRLHAIE